MTGPVAELSFALAGLLLSEAALHPAIIAGNNQTNRILFICRTKVNDTSPAVGKHEPIADMDEQKASSAAATI
ncbi:MAG: hypothetical protein JNM19_16855 [Chitinophagaceae bacterium]|nr:hypothetical protein [Chitinophagaceae bacterium]